MGRPVHPPRRPLARCAGDRRSRLVQSAASPWWPADPATTVPSTMCSLASAATRRSPCTTNRRLRSLRVPAARAPIEFELHDQERHPNITVETRPDAPRSFDARVAGVAFAYKAVPACMVVDYDVLPSWFEEMRCEAHAAAALQLRRFADASRPKFPASLAASRMPVHRGSVRSHSAPSRCQGPACRL